MFFSTAKQSSSSVGQEDYTKKCPCATSLPRSGAARTDSCAHLLQSEPKMSRAPDRTRPPPRTVGAVYAPSAPGPDLAARLGLGAQPREGARCHFENLSSMTVSYLSEEDDAPQPPAAKAPAGASSPSTPATVCLHVYHVSQSDAIRRLNRCVAACAPPLMHIIAELSGRSSPDVVHDPLL